MNSRKDCGNNKGVWGDIADLWPSLKLLNGLKFEICSDLCTPTGNKIMFQHWFNSSSSSFLGDNRYNSN